MCCYLNIVKMVLCLNIQVIVTIMCDEVQGKVKNS